MFGVCRVNQARETRRRITCKILNLATNVKGKERENICEPVGDDARPTLLPCSSSDRERVAGTRLESVGSSVALYARVSGSVGVGERLVIETSSRAETADAGVDRLSRAKLG